MKDLGHLEEQPLVGLDDGLAPVDDLGEGQLPAVGEEHGHAAGLEGLDEAEGAEAAAARDQAEGRVGDEKVEVPPTEKERDTSV